MNNRVTWMSRLCCRRSQRVLHDDTSLHIVTMLRYKVAHTLVTAARTRGGTSLRSSSSRADTIEVLATASASKEPLPSHEVGGAI